MQQSALWCKCVYLSYMKIFKKMESNIKSIPKKKYIYDWNYNLIPLLSYDLKNVLRKVGAWLWREYGILKLSIEKKNILQNVKEWFVGQN